MRRGQRGVTLVEAAFSIPVLFLVILGLVDIGGAVFQTSQASSAAADGARAASVINNLSGAETAGPAHDKIVRAVLGRLTNFEAYEPVITISCRTPSGSAITCASVATQRDTTRVRVDVRWEWEPVSFVGHAIPVRTIDASSTMGLVVLPIDFPTTTTSPTTP